MTNRTVLTALAFAAATLAAPAAIEAQNPMHLGVSGGLAFPISDLGDSHESGWNAAGSLTFTMPVSNLAFRFEGFYNSFQGKDVTVGSAPNLRIAGGSVNAVYHLGGIGVRPYVIGGVGSYNVKLKDAGSRTDFGINAGAGVKFGLGMLNTFVEARLHSISGDDQMQFIPVVFGIEF